MAIGLGDNIGVTGPLPTDNRYFSTLTNKPWASCTDVNTNLAGGVGGVRYTGLTVNIVGTEHWYRDGIEDVDLIEKTSGGGSGTLNMSGDTVGGLTTYVDATTICAQENLRMTPSSLTPSGATGWDDGFEHLAFIGDDTRIRGISIDGGSWGSALTLDEINTTTGAFENTWAIMRGTSGSGSCLDFFYGSNTALPTNSLAMIILTGGTVCAIECFKAPAITLTTGAADGCVLQSDASGNASWATPSAAGGTVTSVIAGNGMTQTGTSTINPTLNVVSHSGTTGTIGTINISADAIGVNLGTTSTTAYRGDCGNAAYTHSTDSSQAHSDYLINNGSDLMNGVLTAKGFRSCSTTTDYSFIGRASVGTVLYVQYGGASGTIARYAYNSMTANGGTEAFLITSTCTKTTGVACATTSVNTPLVNVGNDIVFSDTGTRNICVTPTVGVGQNITITGGLGSSGSNYGGSAVMCGAIGGSASTIPGAGGNAAILAGQGGTNTDIPNGGAGGRAIVRAGSGGDSSCGEGGVGGQAELCAGNGYNAVSCGDGGNVKIQSGCGVSAGCVQIYHGATSRMNSTTTGMYTNGVHCASTCVATPYVCTSVVYGPASVSICAGAYIGAMHYASNNYLRYNGDNKLYTTSGGITVTGSGTATDWISTSDCRLKDCIIPITNALSTVDALCGRCYIWCKDGCPDMGLIAQDVVKIEPMLVSYNENHEESEESDIDTPMGLKYEKMAGLFVEAIKELKQQNESLQKQINELK